MFHLLTRDTEAVIPGLVLHGKPAPYPVVNERSVRAGAGLTFLLGLLAFLQAFYFSNFLFLKILVPILFADFVIKVFLGTRYSLFSKVAQVIVSNQTPEYVGAIQKKFAWTIGMLMSGTMLLLLFMFSVTGLPNMIICGLCLTFMFMESAFGICVGCKMYNALIAHGILATPEYKPVCPGNVCAID